MYAQPFNFGIRVLPAACPSVGVVHGLRLSGVETGFPLLDAITFNYTNAYNDPENINHWIFENGVNAAVILEGEPRNFAFSVTRPETTIDIDVLPSVAAADLECNLFYSITAGNRLRIYWDECEEDDFRRYNLYWDAGLGGSFIILSQLEGRENTAHITAELEAGNYKFRLALEDWAGNESAQGATLTARLRRIPDALDNASITYSSASRTFTVTAESPKGQTAEYIGALIYWNSHPSIVHGDHADKERIFAPAFVGGDVIVWESHTLYAGRWELVIAPVTKWGIEGAEYRKAFELVWDNEDLIDIGDQEIQKPTGITAAAVADGDIEVVVEYNDEAGAYSVNLYEDGILIDDKAEVGAGENPITAKSHKFTVAGRVEGVEHCYSATKSNDYFETEHTARSCAAADATPPDGETLLQYEVIK